MKKPFKLTRRKNLWLVVVAAAFVALRPMVLGAVPSPPDSFSTFYVVDINGKLGTVDAITGVSTVIGPVIDTTDGHVVILSDLAMTNLGSMFGTDSISNLYSINPATGAATPIGVGGTGIAGLNAMVGSPTGGLIAASNGSLNLFPINRVTGKKTGNFQGLLPFASAGDMTTAHPGDAVIDPLTGNPLPTYYITVINGPYCDLVKVWFDASNNQKFFAVNLGHVTVDNTLFALVDAQDGNLYGLDGTAVILIDVNSPPNSGFVHSTVIVSNYAANGSGLGPSLGAVAIRTTNYAPTISGIAPKTINGGTTTGPLPFTVGDVETPVNQLTVTATSSNQALVPNGNLVFGGSGANRTITATPQGVQFGLTTITVTVTDTSINGVQSRSTSFLLTVNAAPTMSAIAALSLNEGVPSGPINFTLADPVTPLANLALSATSSNGVLVKSTNIVFGGSGANRFLTITPNPKHFGSTTITLTVSNGTASASRSFVVTVKAVNDVPLLGDIDGDGLADRIIYRPSNGTWYWLTSSTGFSYASYGSKPWGLPGSDDMPMLADVDGDRKADLIIYRPSDATWYWLTSSSGYTYGSYGSKPWGLPGSDDTPMLADLDGDRLADLIIYRPGSGTWYWLTSSTGYAYGSYGNKPWGLPASDDTPMLADIDGDRLADLIIYRPGDGTWYWLTSSSGYSYGSYGSKPWGLPGSTDMPILADIDGDKKADLVIYRAATGTWYWVTSSTGYDYASYGTKQWGLPGSDIPMQADVDGDGRSDLLIYRAGTGFWYWLTSSTGYNYSSYGLIQWGSPSGG